VRSLIQSSEPDRWQRIAVLMIGHGGEDDPAARAYVVSAIERLPMHERPCRIVVSYGGGGSIAKLKAGDAVVPGADVLGRVKQFNQYVTGPLFGGHFTDFSGPTPIKRPFLEARAQGIAAIIAGARDADDWGNDPGRRETVLDELHRASKDRLKDMAGWNDSNGKALYDANGHARLFIMRMQSVDHDISNGPNVAWEDARHERLSFSRCINLLGMLKIPTGIAYLSACGISKETGCVEYAWKEDAQRTAGLLFNEGQFLRQLHTYAKPNEQGYPMPSAEVGGPTTWIKTQGDTK
jgi:hypothetical protein